MFYKQWVTPEPDTSTIKIDSESEFLILASDGLWDKVCFTIRYVTCLLRSFSGKIIRLHGKILIWIELVLFQVNSEEAVDIARTFCTGEKSNISPQSACKELADLSVKRGSLDDITVMIILLQQFATN